MAFRTKKLSIIDQTICRHYVRVSLCFPFSSKELVQQAAHQIRQGLVKTFQDAPHLAGLICFSKNPEVDGPLVVQYPVDISDVQEPVFVVRERFDDDYPDYKELARSGVHPSAIPGSKFGPLPDSPDLNTPSPVVGVCATFIRGGLVLTIYSQHSLMDGRGLGYFIEDFAANVKACGPHSSSWMPGWWSSVCDQGRHALCPFTLPCLGGSPGTADSLTRERITKSAHEAARSLNDPVCPEFTGADIPCPTKPLSKQPYTKACIFMLDASRLRALRDEIAKFWREDNNPSRRAVAEKIPVFPSLRISTWDAIATLIWISITRARSPLQSLRETTKFGYTIDCRKRLPIQAPARFIGNAALYTYAEFPVSAFTSPSTVELEILAKVALHIRFANMHFNQTAVEDRLSYFASLDEQAPPGNAIDSTFGQDVFMTSWQEMGPCANFGIQGTMDCFDHGLRSYEAGMPTHIRKPGCTPTDGGIILLPRRKLKDQPDDAPFEVMVQLRDDHMKRLLDEKMFMEFVQRVVT